MEKKSRRNQNILSMFSTFKNSLIFTPAIGLVVLFILLSVLSPHFLTISNILNVLRQVSIIAIVSVGMTYAILTGGIDLSVGSVVALSGVIVALLMYKAHFNMYIAMLVGVSTGIVSGFINGYMVASRIRMPPFVSGLAMMAIVRGVALIISDARPIFNLPDQFAFWGGGLVLNIPVPILLMIGVYIIAYINLNHTKLGRNLYAVGGNEEAARVAGIGITRTKLIAYIISGFTAAFGGIILASRVMVGEPIAGYYYELEAIAATVIGGARMGGGEASIIGTLLGALIMAILKNGLNLLDISTYWQQVTIGIVIAVTISLNLLRRR